MAKTNRGPPRVVPREQGQALAPVAVQSLFGLVEQEDAPFPDRGAGEGDPTYLARAQGDWELVGDRLHPEFDQGGAGDRIRD